MIDVKRFFKMDDFEHRLLLGCVNTARNEYLKNGKPIDDVDKLLKKIILAPTKKERHKSDYEGR